MDLNCEISKPTVYSVDKLYCHPNNFQYNVCNSSMFEEKTLKLETGSNSKLFDLLSTIMKENIHHLEMFKSKHFPLSYDCRAENAIKIFFAWSVGVNIKELSEYLDINEDIAKHCYLLSTLYAKRYIKNNIEEWRVGGPGIVTLIDLYPSGCTKFNYATNNNQSLILCIAEIKDIPTNFWFQILTQANPSLRSDEILEVIRTMVRPGSILVIDEESTAISPGTSDKMRSTYQTVVSLESLKKHDRENESLLDNLETIWKPALDICEFGNYHSDISSYYTSFLWNQRFGNDNLNVLLNQF